jgi:chemotaxis protein MotB
MWRRFAGFLGLTAAVALAGCASDWQDKYEEAQRQNLDLVYERDLMRDERAQAVQESEGLKAQVAAQQDDLRRAAAEAEAARRRAEELSAAQQRKPAAPARGDDSALQEILRAIKTRYPAASLSADGNVEIPLDSDVNFASGSDQLTDVGKRSLKGLTGVMNGEFAPYMVRVVGHTDSEPVKRTKDKYGDNFGLGSARALSVVRFLEKDLGIAPTRLMSASKGEHAPVAPNNTPDGKRKNRRVEIVVVIPREAALAQAR